MATENGTGGLAQDPTKVSGLGAAPTADPKGKGKAVATDDEMKDASMAEDDDDEEEDGAATVSLYSLQDGPHADLLPRTTMKVHGLRTPNPM